MFKRAFQQRQIALHRESAFLRVAVLPLSELVQRGRRQSGRGKIQTIQKRGMARFADNFGEHGLKTDAGLSGKSFRVHGRGLVHGGKVRRAGHKTRPVFGKEPGATGSRLRFGRRRRGVGGRGLPYFGHVARTHFARRRRGPAVHFHQTEFAEASASAQSHAGQQAFEHAVESDVVFFGQNRKARHAIPRLSSLPAGDRLHTISASWSGPAAAR